MLLTFGRDSFVESIKNGTKKHTIREDKTNRWKKGMNIHFWRGNPRNVKSKPYQFGKGKCIHVAFIEIYPNVNIVKISHDGINYDTFNKIDALDDLANNDGFMDWEHMKEWFNTDFKGKMIFWGAFSCA